MATLIRNARKAALQLLVICVSVLGMQLPALELSDIPYPLTRDQADNALSKDYTYAMLADGTLRRSWQTKDKTIIIDFDTNTNEALLIAVTYNTPVAKKDGIQDAHTLGKGNISENAKWDSPKDKASKELISDTFGLKNAKRKKLNDKAMLFYETNDKGTKVTRISLFSRLPKNNRWELPVVSPGGTKSAMGTNWADDYVEAVYADEARRQAKPVKSSAASASSSSATDTQDAPPSRSRGEATTATPEQTVSPQPQRRVTRTAMGNRITKTQPTDAPAPTPTQTESRPSGTSTVSSTPRTKPTTTKTVISEGQQSRTVSTLPPAPSFLKQFGVEDPQWWHYIALGILALIALFMLFRGISRAKQNATQQKQFTKVLGGKPLGK